ncbi:hypothetical protein FRB99_007622 [Tulasnella sp. 403]|nr:hypothetical protein FRB99_007622 [Tulasnella sp. 403]
MAENVVYLGEGTFGCVYGLKSAVTGKIVAAIKAPKPYMNSDASDEIKSLKQVNNIKKSMHLLFMVYHDGVISVETDGWHKFVSPTGDFSLSPGMDVAACEKFIDTLMGSIVDRALEYARQGAFNHDLSFKNALFNEGYPQNPTVVFVDWGNSNVIENPSDTTIAEYKELARQYIADLAMVCSMQDPE